MEKYKFVMQLADKVFEFVMGIALVLGLTFIIMIFAYALDPSDSSNPHNIVIEESK